MDITSIVWNPLLQQFSGHDGERYVIVPKYVMFERKHDIQRHVYAGGNSFNEFFIEDEDRTLPMHLVHEYSNATDDLVFSNNQTEGWMWSQAEFEEMAAFLKGVNSER